MGADLRAIRGGGPVPSTVEYARDLLARCERGEVLSITVVEEIPGDSYTVGGSSCESRTRMAGMLLDAAMMRLNQGRNDG